jgi:tRNA (cmo5U34)-methyltransferase
MKIPKIWTFKNHDVAQHFDDHVREQLPWYTLATDSVAHIVRHYLPRGGVVYDIGASTGNVGRAIEDILVDRDATLYAVEESNEMLSRYHGPGKLIGSPAQAVEFEDFDVAVLFLVMMFMSVEDRTALLKNLLKRLRRGGVIIVFDKQIAPSGYFGTVLRRLTMDWKIKNGATPEAIVEKELALSGVQRPISPLILGQNATCFFTFGEFGGWVIERPE